MTRRQAASLALAATGAAAGFLALALCAGRSQARMIGDLGRAYADEWGRFIEDVFAIEHRDGPR